MIPAQHTARRLSVLHIFKVYYPDLFGGNSRCDGEWPASVKFFWPHVGSRGGQASLWQRRS
jgi:hypothetical protein